MCVAIDQPPFDGPPLLSDIVGPPPEVDPLVGTTLADRYRITHRLGDGGMGSVYLAEHTTLGKRVALKLLKPEFNDDANLVERFFREARATAAIQHENVVDILDFGQTPGYAFFVMEPLSGCELADLIGRGRRLPWTRVKSIMIQIVRALAAAHAAGIVHRDMKPGNVFLIDRGGTPDFVKVLDFGIAKIDDGVRLTQAGTVFGTASYMAPEQATGGEVDGRADIYAVGCMLFEALTGQLPFPGDNFMKVLNQHIREPPPRLRDVAPKLELPPGVEELVAKALEKLPWDRFADMTEFERALAAIPDLTGEHGGAAHEFGDGPPVLGSYDAAPTSKLEESGHAQATMMMPGMGGAILRDAVAAYGRAPNDPAQLRDARATLASKLADDRHAQLITDLREIASADGRIDAMVRSLAFIYLALAHAADGMLDAGEMRVVGEQLRQWAPEASHAEAGAALRDAVAEYKRLAGAQARLDRARAAADTLKQSAGQDTLRRILADLWRIAGADGHICAEEQRFIMEIVARFN